MSAVSRARSSLVSMNGTPATSLTLSQRRAERQREKNTIYLSHKFNNRIRRSQEDLTYNQDKSSTRLKKEEECIGFATLPDQIHRKVIKKGFHFTIMVVGESGLGKSTLINSLFMTDLYKDRKPLGVEDKIDSTVSIEAQNLDIEEGGVKLRLTILDTPGFSDSLSGEESIKPVESYLDDQFHQYFEAENGLNRKNIRDSRVHCLLYFISPYGHGLKPVDIECMKRLHHKVNILPVIAKADTLTLPEINRHKKKVLQDIKQHGIRIYDFPECDEDEDEIFKRQDAELKAAIPFAIVGSNTITEIGGKRVRARIYPWGIVEAISLNQLVRDDQQNIDFFRKRRSLVGEDNSSIQIENESHSDFTKLRKMLIGTHLQDLKDVTEEFHYENYRARYIQASDSNKEEMTENNNLLSKDSEKVEQLLHEKEEEIKKMQAVLEAMKQQMQASVI